MKKISLITPATQPFEEQVFCNFKGFTVEVCRRPESLAAAFHLRYRAYVAVDAIPPNEEELLYDDFDFMPNSRIHLVWFDGKAVATVRSCIWSGQYDWTPTEAINYFQQDIKQEIGTNTTLLESNRFAVDPDFQGRQSLFAQILMFRIHALNSAVHNCEYIITAVRENHVPFYRRFLGMEVISRQSYFVSWANAEVLLMASDRENSLQTALKRGLPEVLPQDIERYAMCAEIPCWSSSQMAA